MQGTISRRLWAKAGAERIPLTGAFELLPICNLALIQVENTYDGVMSVKAGQKWKKQAD